MAPKQSFNLLPLLAEDQQYSTEGILARAVTYIQQLRAKIGSQGLQDLGFGSGGE